MDITAYVTDVRTLILAALTVIDLIAGTVRAIKNGTFDPERLGDWFESNQLKYLAGYGLAWFAAIEGLPAAINGTDTVGEVTAWLLLIPAVVAVGTSIYRNVTAPTVAPETAEEARHE